MKKLTLERRAPNDHGHLAWLVPPSWIVAPFAVLVALVACSGGKHSSSSGQKIGGTKTGSAGTKGASGANPSGGVFGNALNPSPLPGARGVTTDEDAGHCVNLQCRKHACAGGGSTTVSGTVYDPAGRNPLYNVAVYVPNEPVQALPSGASCDTCDSLYTGTPVAAAVSDGSGNFSMKDVPDGADIPLVVQVGKWRKQFTIPIVTACQENPLPDHSLRLPRNHVEGDVPNIAIATGGADTLECLLRRVGVDASEYTPGDTGAGRIHIFHGSMPAGVSPSSPGFHAIPNTLPAAPEAPDALWDTIDHLMRYDILLLSCEGDETVAMNQQALHDFASAGGRVFASHFHYSWFNSGPYASENIATWTPGPNTLGNISATIVTTLPNGRPFPKGQALHDWLGIVGALTNDELPITDAKHNADVSTANRVTQSWIVADQNAKQAGATEYLSFNTPTDAAMTPDGPGYCGRVVYSDLHVGAASMDDPNQPVPAECTDRDPSPQEKALEFMLFDLSSCLTPDNKPPPPPTVKVL